MPLFPTFSLYLLFSTGSYFFRIFRFCDFWLPTLLIFSFKGFFLWCFDNSLTISLPFHRLKSTPLSSEYVLFLHLHFFSLSSGSPSLLYLFFSPSLLRFVSSFVCRGSTRRPRDGWPPLPDHNWSMRTLPHCCHCHHHADTTMLILHRFWHHTATTRLIPSALVLPVPKLPFFYTTHVDVTYVNTLIPV